MRSARRRPVPRGPWLDDPADVRKVEAWLKRQDDRRAAGEPVDQRYEAVRQEYVAYAMRLGAPSLSEHARLEITAVFHRGRPLGYDEPVPGCACVGCATLAAGGTWDDVDEVELAVEVLAGLPSPERIPTAAAWAHERRRLGHVVFLPPPGVLAVLAAQVPGALRAKPRSRADRRAALHVEEARRVPILDVVARLGLGEPVRRGREVAVRCPFHHDHDPSLRINPTKNTWFCDPCGSGGDAIELLTRAQGIEFAEAVRELAD